MAQLPSSARVNQYTATSGQTVFIYDFMIYEDDEIKVQQGDTTLTLTTHYTVQDAGESAGGTITLVTGATLGDIITLTGNTMVERGTTFSQGGAWNASAVNGEFDRLDNLISEQVTQSGLNFKLATYSETVSPTIPNPTARRALVWNSGGTALENSTYDPDTYADAAATSAAAAAASAAAASTSETNAATSEANAATSASEAAASAASINPAAFASDLIPDADGTRDLGSAAKEWAEVHATDAFIYNDLTVTGDVAAATFNSETVQRGIEFARVQDIKSQGTAGGTYTNGAWRTRDLTNITVDGITGLSLGSNQITFPAGTYIIEAFVPSYNTSVHQAKLYNVTAAADISGSFGQTKTATSTVMTPIAVKVTFGVESVVEVRGQVLVTASTNGMGFPGNISGLSEYYTDVRIWRIA